MTTLYDMFDIGLFQTMRDLGYLRVQQHATLPLAIANYGPKAQYEREWNAVTTQCRGLIYRTDTHEIVARPFPKFFNLGEHSDAELPAEPFRVFDKMDGSLGILYSLDTVDWAVATRGSFASDQARWATQKFKDYVEFVPLSDRTYLFEIVYPANRIVVDYGGLEQLILLDVIDKETGESRLDEERRRLRPFGWPGPTVEEYDGFDALESLLAAEQPLNSEGYVIRFEGGMRVKVKHDEYVRLHRIVTGVSTKTIWEYLSQDRPLEELLDRVPDEFFAWVQTQMANLTGAFHGIQEECEHDFDVFLRQILNTTAEAWREAESAAYREDRKAFAIAIKDHPHRDVLFLMLDHRDFAENIWKRIKPAYEKPFMAISEDVA